MFKSIPANCHTYNTYLCSKICFLLKNKQTRFCTLTLITVGIIVTLFTGVPVNKKSQSAQSNALFQYCLQVTKRKFLNFQLFQFHEQSPSHKRSWTRLQLLPGPMRSSMQCRTNKQEATAPWWQATAAKQPAPTTQAEAATPGNPCQITWNESPTMLSDPPSGGYLLMQILLKWKSERWK